MLRSFGIMWQIDSSLLGMTVLGIGNGYLSRYLHPDVNAKFRSLAGKGENIAKGCCTCVGCQKQVFWQACHGLGRSKAV